jgi:hypothetical protein
VELAVIDAVARPSPNRQLLQFLSETPDEPVLVTDIQRSGRASLFFAIATTDEEVITQWLRKMSEVTIFVTYYKGDFIIAAPVAAFSVC